MKNSRLLFLLFLLTSLPSMAQIGVYTEYGASKLNAPHADWVNGPIVGVYADKGHLLILKTGLDMRGSFLFGGDYTHLYNFLVGPRIAIKPPVEPLQPYVEGLFGLGHYKSGSLPEVGRGPAMTSSNQMEYQIVGGMDLKMAPLIDWRVIEFSYSGISGLGASSNPRAVSMGVVLHLP